MRTVLLDGDIWCYQATAANEYEAQWDTWLWTLHGDFNAAQEQFDRTVEFIKKGLKADKVVIALSDSTNWRKKVMPAYKSNRVKTRKPVCYQPLREYIHEKYDVFQRPGLEGDDILGILSTSTGLFEGDLIVVSIDKDMKTLPGLHVNHTHALTLPEYDQGIYRVSKGDADRFHLFQTLTGDTTDGYSGCPGVGPKTAETLLSEGKVLTPHEHTLKSGPRKGEKETRWEPGASGTPWQVVVSAYASAGLSESVALTTARVARILRATDYDFEKKEPILWVAK